MHGFQAPGVCYSWVLYAIDVPNLHGLGSIYMDSQTDKQITAFLEAHRTAALATVDADGRPHAANVQYVSDDGLNLYWVSSPGSEHSLHLADRPDAALTVYAHVDAPDQIHGVQMHGRAEVLSDTAAVTLVRALYEATYPFAAEPPYRDAVAAQSFYRFQPTWLRWIDNRQGFGWKMERKL